jgi:cytochrome c-type biogenesis protein CcmE
MIAARKRKMGIIVLSLLMVSLAAALILYALRQNISLFYTPTQAVKGEAPLKKHIRIGGMVEKGSLIRGQRDLVVQFKVTDFKQTVTIIYKGILPDLFREGQGIVAEGQLQDGLHFKATQVLAKHDEKYMPPEVKDMLSNKVPA